MFGYTRRQLVRGLLNRMPGKNVRWLVAHRLAKRRFYRHIRRLASSAWVTPVDPGPPWTPEVQMASSLMHAQSAESLARNSNDRFYGRAFKEWNIFLQVLEKNSFNFRNAGAVLEVGCGSARLIRMLRCVEGLRLVGTDINPQCVQWCKENIPGAEFYVNQAAPPLTFAADKSFDLVIAYSVFTHILPELQRPWLQEVHRVLRPGGYFLNTVVGHNHRKQQLREDELKQLSSKGEVVLEGQSAGLSYSSKLRGLCDIFQTRAKIIENVTDVFDLVDFLPGEELSMGQDLLVLRRPEELKVRPAGLRAAVGC